MESMKKGQLRSPVKRRTGLGTEPRAEPEKKLVCD